MIEIINIDDPRVAPFRDLKSKRDTHKQSGLFVAEGIKTSLQLLNSKLEIASVFALEEFYIEFNDLIQIHKVPEEMKYTASKEIMNQVVGFRIHSGIMILAREPEPVSIEGLGSRIVVMNGIIDSENVGAIVRNSIAFGFDSIIADEATSSPYLRRAVRVSMGTVFYSKIHYSEKITSTLLKLKKDLGYRIIGAEIAESAIPVDIYSFSEKCAIVFGTESKGISPEVLELCDDLVYIPINPLVNSINVAASSAVMLREAGIAVQI